MNDIPLRYQEAVDTYEPVDFEGIKLFPILVRDYAAYTNARPAINILQQSLPVRFVSMPLLSAYYKMDVYNFKTGRRSDGLFARALMFLVLALRYRTDLDMEERLTEFGKGIVSSADDQSVLKGIVFQQDGVEHKITPILFQRMRPILAAQNGIELISTDANPELVEADRDIAEANGPRIDYNHRTLLTSLAVLTKTPEKEIYDWPILKFTRCRDAYSRILSYLVYGFAAATGVQFKGGNPVPSPFFDRLDQDSDSLIDMDLFTGPNPVATMDKAPSTAP